MRRISKQIVSIGLAGALLFSVVDLALSVQPIGPRLMDPAWFALVLGLSVGAQLGIYLLICRFFLQEPRGEDQTPLEARAVVVSAMTGLGIAAGLSPMLAIPALGLFLAILGAVRLGVWAARRSAEWKAFFCALPKAMILLTLGAMVFLWFANYSLHPDAPNTRWAAIAAYVAFTLAVLSPLVLRWKSVSRAAVVLALAAVFLSPAIPLAPSVNASSAGAIGTANSAQIRQVVLIVVDTLRADALSTLNPAAGPTPNIDRFAAESVVFENAISPAPWTVPSMDSLMKGVPPYNDRAGMSYGTAPLPTMASYFRDAGYRTRGIAANQILLQELDLTSGLQGYDWFCQFPFGLSRAAQNLYNLAPELFERGGATRQVTDRARSWVAQNREEPYFLWVHYFDPHDPYAPPKEYWPADLERPTWRREFHEAPAGDADDSEAGFDPGDPVTPADPVAQELYDAEVRYIDSEIGRLLEGLRRQGVYDDALIILTSDHGEEFQEHGGNYHARTLYQEVVHVPLIVRLPGGKNARRVKEHVPVYALAPTVVELSGLEADNRWWTRSLAPQIHEATPPPYSEPIIASATYLDEFQRAVVLDGMKFIARLESGKQELYDLAADPLERRSVLEQRPDVVARAREALQDFELRSLGIRQEFGVGGDEAIPHRMQDSLRSLGYIQ